MSREITAVWTFDRRIRTFKNLSWEPPQWTTVNLKCCSAFQLFTWPKLHAWSQFEIFWVPLKCSQKASHFWHFLRQKHAANLACNKLSHFFDAFFNRKRTKVSRSGDQQRVQSFACTYGRLRGSGLFLKQDLKSRKNGGFFINCLEIYARNFLVY